MYRLSQIPMNVPCVVHEIQEGNLGYRLLSMGLVPGTEVTKVLRSPGGDPMGFSVNGDFIIGLRTDEAELVTVYLLV